MTEKELKNNAAYAIKKLKQYRVDFKKGLVSREVVTLVAKAHIEAYDKYTRLMAKKHKVPFRKFSLSAFLR
jgi:hypothetical protein